MENDGTVLVKISMPESLANRFFTESKIVFGDCRWLNIMFKDKMYNALLGKESSEVISAINSARAEIVFEIDQLKQLYYNLNKKRSDSKWD